MTVRVGVTGAAGRMGRMLIDTLVNSALDLSLTAALERPGSALIGVDTGALSGVGRQWCCHCRCAGIGDR